MSSSIITLTTDFGAGGSYVGQMKGVILSINPQATLVDITHDIPPQDIRTAALVLDEATTRFPAGSIHVAVVDPGVGTERGIVAAEIAGRYYVAPDNGLLSLLFQRVNVAKTVTVTERRCWLPHVSKTFHGRDIMSPVAAYLSLGTPIDQLGPPQQNLLSLDWPAVRIAAGAIHGQIIAVDSFGNLITNIRDGDLAALKDPAKARIQCGNHEITGLSQTYGQQPAGSIIALSGSSGRLELAVVQGNAGDRMNARMGDAVTIR